MIKKKNKREIAAKGGLLVGTEINEVFNFIHPFFFR